MRWLYGCFCLLIGLTLITCEQANLLSQKKFLTFSPSVTRDLIVQIKIYNVGEGFCFILFLKNLMIRAAYDVRLNDSNYSKDEFSLVSGTPFARWDKIPAGGNVSHSFVIHPEVAKIHVINPSVILYRQSPRGHDQVSYSTDLGNVKIGTGSERDKRNTPHLEEWGIFSLLSLVATLPFFLYWRSIVTSHIGGIPKKKK